MRQLRGFLFFVGAFLFLGFVFFFVGDAEITGNVPLTGVLKEETGEPVVVQDYDVSWELEDDLIHRLRDLSFSVKFVPELEGKSIVDLNYMVFNMDGEMVYYDEESVVIEGETIVNRDLDTYDAHGVGLEDGNYSFVLRVSYADVEKSFSEKFEYEEISPLLYSLKQLFDIRLELDSRVIESAEDLSVSVVFESFGEEPTPVNLTFFIYDSMNEEIYRMDTSTVVETEQVVFVDFEDFEAPEGEYLLVMRSFYNVDVEDYFEQSFEIRRGVSVWPFMIAGIVLIFGVYFLFIRERK